jgi:hypothetical protein
MLTHTRGYNRDIRAQTKENCPSLVRASGKLLSGFIGLLNKLLTRIKSSQVVYTRSLVMLLLNSMNVF